MSCFSKMSNLKFFIFLFLSSFWIDCQTLGVLEAPKGGGAHHKSGAYCMESSSFKLYIHYISTLHTNNQNLSLSYMCIKFQSLCAKTNSNNLTNQYENSLFHQITDFILYSEISHQLLMFFQLSQ